MRLLIVYSADFSKEMFVLDLVYKTFKNSKVRTKYLRSAIKNSSKVHRVTFIGIKLKEF